MTRLTLALAVWISLVSAAPASLASRQDRLRSGNDALRSPAPRPTAAWIRTGSRRRGQPPSHPRVKDTHSPATSLSPQPAPTRWAGRRPVLVAGVSSNGALIGRQPAIAKFSERVGDCPPDADAVIVTV